MIELTPTQRVYTHKLTGEKFRFFTNPCNTSVKILISETTGLQMPYFLIAAFTDTDFKLRNKKIVRLSIGEVLPIDMNNPPTHKKFFMQKRFSKY